MTERNFLALLQALLVSWLFENHLDGDNEFVVRLSRLLAEWAEYYESIEKEKESHP